MPNLQEKECKYHGLTTHYGYLSKKRQIWKCKKCNVERVSQTRRDHKTKLIEAFGGRCILCNYARFQGALKFHHKDPDGKDFSISHGETWSYSKMFKETKKCILVCANCHREIHAGIIKL